MYFSSNGASRLDRLYTTPEIFLPKTGIEIIPAAFTDHHAVALRLQMPETSVHRGPGRWKMDSLLMNDEHIRRRIGTEWVERRKRKQCYPDVTQWWERSIKKRIRIFIRREMADRNTDFRLMENLLYACIYDVLRSDIPDAAKLPALQRYKAKLVRLHARRI
jgi:hypothetical protein